MTGTNHTEMKSEMDLEQIRGLMMAALDDECSTTERQVLMRALEENPELQREWRELQRVKEVTSMISVRKPPDEIWADYWTQVYARNERRVAWVLVSLGSIVLLSWGLWQWISHLLADQTLPGFIKFGIAMLAVGLVILAVSVVREKMFVNKHDPYKDIER